ncbi:glutathione S-transferase family protein [Microvirga lotononidis]|uniref:Glutathione S-transferase n=1 Tax=Microvirga lotononidis TaxID=864069 RepID=I4YL79_9HYPH|nr:glutathione S-transferase family protein [Microvirga lotononidis]EIM24721.1 glutathione S-transferase [Microvirga lotononidis]WQO26728.1 glutathione S-transferase family protein [Microvirga lotononidis]
MPSRFELHGFAYSGPTYKVALALSLMGEPFDYVHVNMMGGEHKQPSYLSRQRYGQVPLLVDRNNGRQLCQSAAILEYLADMTGRFGGADLDERLQAREWLYWDFDRLASPLYKVRVVKAGFRQAAPEVVEDCLNAARNALGVLDAHLAGRAWLVGEGATIADIDIYGVVTFSDQAGIDLTGYPQVEAWVRRVEALPGFEVRTDLLPMESRVAA